ncbi:MAG: hypothetical protein JW838_09120 [Spirochaetes bacterium]|nr:hypothetical protein [Spirochaetota bacterium]
MKVKYFFVALIALLLLVSISQIFSIPPYAENIFPVYKSGYFEELERGFGIVTDSFIGIKKMARPDFAWVFLSDIEKAHGMKIRVYDHRGRYVPAPGEVRGGPDPTVVEVLSGLDPDVRSEVRGGKFFTVIPVPERSECRFCHSPRNGRGMIGALSFERGYDAGIYYSSERIIIFISLSIILGALLYAVIRWDPGRNIKELFDK